MTAFPPEKREEINTILQSLERMPLPATQGQGFSATCVLFMQNHGGDDAGAKAYLEQNLAGLSPLSGVCTDINCGLQIAELDIEGQQPDIVRAFSYGMMLVGDKTSALACAAFGAGGDKAAQTATGFDHEDISAIAGFIAAGYMARTPVFIEGGIALKALELVHAVRPDIAANVFVCGTPTDDFTMLEDTTIDPANPGVAAIEGLAKVMARAIEMGNAA